MLVIFLLLFGLTCEAKTVLIQAPDAAALDYRAMLKAHPDFISPSERYLNSHPLRVNREHLLNLFAQAQKSFLENSNEEAQGRFEALLDLLAADDWEKPDREIFLHASLRLAQMASQESSRDRWLRFSLTLGEDGYDKDLFPPPLLARRSELLAHIQKISKMERLFALGWNAILVNGEVCDRSNCPAWPLLKERVRVTYLSDRWLPQTVNLNLTEIERYTPRATAQVSGECGHDQVHATVDHPDRKVFWSLECDLPTQKLNLLPITRSGFNARPPEEKSGGIPFYKSKWFWAIVGGAVTAAIVVNAQKKETKEPTTSYGY